MKLLILLFVVGFASASLYDALDDAAEEIYHDFMVGMEHAPSLKEALELPADHYYADDAEYDVKTELGRKLRETLDHLVAKIKDALENGKDVGKDFMEKLRELKEKLKNKEISMKELVEKVREKAKEILRHLLEKLDNKHERSIEDEMDVAFVDFNIKSVFKKLKEVLKSKIDKDKLKAKIEELFGKGNEMADSLLEVLKAKGEQGKQKILDMIDRFLGEHERRSVKDMWEKVKEYFKDLHIDLKEKYQKFGEWVKNVIDKGLTHSKDKIENIKSIAREFIDHTKGVSKEVAVEALEFLRPYKDDLGSLWDQLKVTVKDIINRKDE